MTRFGWVMSTYFATIAVGLSVLFHPSPKTIWNASASVPIGLYAIHPAGTLYVTELVVVRPPEPLATFLAERRYLPKGVPLLKRILALSGQKVCWREFTITVDGIAMGEALDRDSRGQKLPVWQGCRVVAAGEVFLMNWQSDDSLDGRYFWLSLHQRDPWPGRSPLDTRRGMTLPRRRGHIALRAFRHSQSSLPAIPAFHMRPSARNPETKRGAAFGASLALALMIGCSIVHAESAAPRPVREEAMRVPFAALVAEASQRFGIPASWIRAVMHAESFGDVRAISPKGAMGLMQIMPGTWPELRQRYHLGADPYDAHDNIIAGAGFLRELHDRYGAPGFLAAYNAGPGRWEDYLATGRPLPAETRAYLAHLTPIIGGGGAVDGAVALASAVRSWTVASLFPTQPAPPSDASQSAPTQQSSRPSRGHPAQDWTALAPRSDGLFVNLSNRERSP